MERVLIPAPTEHFAGASVILDPARSDEAFDIALSDPGYRIGALILPEEQAESVIGRRSRREREDLERNFAVVTKEDKRIAGLVEISLLGIATRCMLISYWVTPADRDWAVATDGLCTAARWAAEHGARQVDLLMAPGDPVLQQIATAAGFTRLRCDAPDLEAHMPLEESELFTWVPRDGS